MKPRLIVGLAMLSCIGCAHTIQYKLSDDDQWQGAKIDKTLRVETFRDETSPVTQQTFVEDVYTYRTNYRDGYKNKEIADGVTQMVVKHLQASKLFKNVVDASSKQPADYELGATIAEYYGQGRVNKGAEGAELTGAALFSLAGALVTMGATAGEKTEIQARVNLQKITLRPASSTDVVWQTSISMSTNFSAHFSQADAPMVFFHPDRCLKTAVTELIRQMAAALQTNAVGAVPSPVAGEPPGPAAQK
jgi:hypothetical protein